MQDSAIKQLLTETKIIAVVGLSNKFDRPSYRVAAYLIQHGYQVVGVNPALQGQPVLTIPSYDTLAQAQAALKNVGQTIDMVDVFRRVEDIPQIAEEAIAIGAKSLWLQLNLNSPEAEEKASAAGLKVVADHCIKIEHARLFQ